MPDRPDETTAESDADRVAAQPAQPYARPLTGSPRWLLVLTGVGAVLALLLLGAAVGLLLGLRESEANAAPAPDSVDVGFCQDMTVHHRQAATMAALARDRSGDQRIRTLAFDIETTQLEQVGRMQGWLSLWGRDRLPTGKHMGWMSADHGHTPSDDGDSRTEVTGVRTPVTQMPGMATPDELSHLAKVTGPELDVLFLQLMLRHHQGGTIMMRYAAAHAEVGVVRNLAGQMLVSQGKEIEYLTQLLAVRGAQPLPAPN